MRWRSMRSINSPAGCDPAEGSNNQGGKRNGTQMAEKNHGVAFDAGALCPACLAGICRRSPGGKRQFFYRGRQWQCNRQQISERMGGSLSLRRFRLQGDAGQSEGRLCGRTGERDSDPVPSGRDGGPRRGAGHPDPRSGADRRGPDDLCQRSRNKGLSGDRGKSVALRPVSGTGWNG